MMLAKQKTVTINLVMAAVLLTAGLSHAAQSVGAKLWFAEWEALVSGMFTRDLGDGLMYGLQYNLIPGDGDIAYSAQVGWGSGWDYTSDDPTEPKADYTRTDLLLTASGKAGCFHYGAGYYYMKQDRDGNGYWADWEGIYHGPELLGGVVLPIGESGFSAGASVLYIPILFYDAEEKGIGWSEKQDGDTYAYGFDINVGLACKNWRFAVGYREQDIEGDDKGVSDDNFGGAYVAAAAGL